jgi:hypothetical protein
MKRLYFIPLLMCLFFSVLSCMNPPEDIPEEPGEDAILTLLEVSENTLGIDLTNDIPVRGVQFTLEGPEIIDVLTTSRTEEFSPSFNEENGTVILISLSGDEIAAGKGLIAEIIYDDGGGSASLSEIKIVE